MSETNTCHSPADLYEWKILRSDIIEGLRVMRVCAASSAFHVHTTVNYLLPCCNLFQSIRCCASRQKTPSPEVHRSISIIHGKGPSMHQIACKARCH